MGENTRCPYDCDILPKLRVSVPPCAIIKLVQFHPSHPIINIGEVSSIVSHDLVFLLDVLPSIYAEKNHNQPQCYL